MRRRRVSAEMRFATFHKADASGCWLWTGALTRGGYGVFQVDRRAVRAHRYSYLIHIGRIPDGSMVCHRCDVRNCVNPKHLFLGDQESNMADMVAKRRSAHGSKNAWAKLTMADAQHIRIASANGIPYSKLASVYKVSKTVIKNVVLGLSYVCA